MAEMALFMLLLVPLPFSAKRKIFTYVVGRPPKTTHALTCRMIASSPRVR